MRTGADSVSAKERVNGWGEGAAGDERAWMRGRLRKAWVQESGWKAGDERASVRGWTRIVPRTAGARDWVEMGGEKEPVEMSELGCARVEMGWGKESLGMSELGCTDGCVVQGSGWVGKRSRWG
eukprot:s4_g38.t1